MVEELINNPDGAVYSSEYEIPADGGRPAMTLIITIHLHGVRVIGNTWAKVNGILTRVLKEYRYHERPVYPGLIRSELLRLTRENKTFLQQLSRSELSALADHVDNVVETLTARES